MWIYQALPRALKNYKELLCTMYLDYSSELRSCLYGYKVHINRCELFSFYHTGSIHTTTYRVLPHTREKHGIEKGVGQHLFI